MVTITLNGEALEVDAGRPLVEVIKEQGVRITNLCYMDGLEPYAGCRTCIVEIEDTRPTPLVLSCTAVTADGMVVNTEKPEVKRARQQVMSLIMANHPDRCLTCHRRVHCQPGEICLRDDVVTHRCLTCSKNYRCELQTSTELIDMGEFEEPWVGEERSYYETPPPEVDRANPFLEFDPQMCIICTRCVRACADLRHTGAISLSGKGPTTMIAFGTGGAVHESNCDFCGRLHRCLPDGDADGEAEQVDGAVRGVDELRLQLLRRRLHDLVRAARRPPADRAAGSPQPHEPRPESACAGASTTTRSATVSG